MNPGAPGETEGNGEKEERILTQRRKGGEEDASSAVRQSPLSSPPTYAMGVQNPAGALARLKVNDEDKPLVWLKGEVKTPPFSSEARIEAGTLLRRLQQGAI